MIPITENSTGFVGSGERLSTCCGARDRETVEDGPSYEDIGLCSECRDHCGEYEQTCLNCDELESDCDCAVRTPYAVPALPTYSEIALFLILAFVAAWFGTYTATSADASLQRNYPAIQADVRRVK